MQDPTICAAISGFGTILTLLAATLGAMAVAGIFKELSGEVRRQVRKLLKPHKNPKQLKGRK